MSSTFLEPINSDGSEVRVPGHIIERVPPFVRKLEARFLSAVAQKRDIVTASASFSSVAFTLPMPLMQSPILLLLKAAGAAEDCTTASSTFPAYTYYSATMARLCQMFAVIRSGFFPDIEQRTIEQAIKAFDQERGLNQATFMREIGAILETQPKGGPFSQQVTEAFLKRMELETFKLINRYERFLHATLIGDKRIPSQLCMTPPVTPSVDKLLIDDRLRFHEEAFVQFWTLKLEITNAELERDANVKPVRWLTLDGLSTAHKQCPPQELWRGYLTPKTTHEYMTYFQHVNDL